MRYLLCKTCVDNTDPPDEPHRIVRGYAKKPTKDQMVTKEQTLIAGQWITTKESQLSTHAYICDMCDAEIFPGDRAGAISVWPMRHNRISEWESDYLTVTTSVEQSGISPIDY